MKKNVLLVEDDPALRMVMREVLKEEFEIVEADNGDDGIDKGLNLQNDLIILDYHLPKKDGLQVIERVKAMHPNLPIIVMTGYLNPDSEAAFNRLGASKIFPKPFNYRNLLETVRSLMLNRETTETASSEKLACSLPPKLSETPKLAPTEQTMLTDSLEAIAGLAEKVEFLKSISEKYWIDPSDISTIRETARTMESLLQSYYGKLNNTTFNSGEFTSPLIGKIRRPSLSGNN